MSNYILWLPSWYPNTFSPLDGDFIQRHARAASLLNKIIVVFVKKDEAGNVTKTVKREVTTLGNLTEITIYYHPRKTGIKLLDKFLSRKMYNSVYKKTLEDLVNNNKPDLVHVHVTLPAGNIALWLKKNYSLPFIISEHWTGYLPEAKPNLDNKSFLYKGQLQKVFKNAEAVTTVSNVLG